MALVILLIRLEIIKCAQSQPMRVEETIARGVARSSALDKLTRGGRPPSLFTAPKCNTLYICQGGWRVRPCTRWSAITAEARCRCCLKTTEDRRWGCSYLWTTSNDLTV